jgi:hypothetical protein
MSEGLHPGVHPSPDALNAFVESALAEHERMECLGHLAKCAQCREVVFLAQKAAEIEAPAAAPEAPVPFWRRLIRPMAIVSVAATAILAVLFVGRQRMTPSPEPQSRITANTQAPVETAQASKAAVRPPAFEQAPKKASPRPVPKEAHPPTAASVTAPAVTAPLVAVASAPQPTPQPAPVAAAQQIVEGGRVSGTIVDPAGAVIASARVELKNENTGATYASTSDAHGQYSIEGLVPGRYDFSVTSSGFKKFVRPGINVEPQVMARLNSTLDVGAAAESVTVTAETALLKTESAEASLPALALTGGNLAAATATSPLYTLPDNSTSVSAALKDKLVVAIDSAGSLFVSENAGKNWTRVKPPWKGKALRVALSADAKFVLTVDPASTWVSADGRRWSQAQPSR